MITTRSTTSRSSSVSALVATTIRGVATALQARWSVMRNRRRMKSLEDFDDHLLADIGLTRQDLRAARTLPSHLDPTLRLAAIVRDHEAANAHVAARRPRGCRGD